MREFREMSRSVRSARARHQRSVRMRSGAWRDARVKRRSAVKTRDHVLLRVTPAALLSEYLSRFVATHRPILEKLESRFCSCRATNSLALNFCLTSILGRLLHMDG